MRVIQRRFLQRAAASRISSSGGEHLDAPIEVTRHQIRAADPRRDAVACSERQDAAVLQERAENAANRDSVAHSGDARSENADATCHRLDAYARL